MSVSMMNAANAAPTTFQPTLHSDYFFNEPSSPVPPADAYPQHSPSPELPESPPADGARGGYKRGAQEAVPMEWTEEDARAHATGAQPAEAMAIDKQHQPSRSLQIVPDSSGDSPTHFTFMPVSSPPSKQQELASSLITAATATVTTPVSHTGNVTPHQHPMHPPPMERAQSSSCATSAPSTAASSHLNSPRTPSTFDSSQSGPASAVHTPSPPPLVLPQAAGIQPPPAGQSMYTPQPTPTHQLFPQQQQLQPQQSAKAQTPATTPTRYRTVPAAAAQITPVKLPDSVPEREPYHRSNTQHAQTPLQPPRHHHPTYSNPTSPPHGHRHKPHRSLEPLADPNAEYVGPFILGPVLGRGCTGTVRLGTHKRNGFEVAFKIIERKYLQSDPKLWAKVKREIVILKLVEHKNVLKLYDVLETENRLYLVLEHVKGGELFDYIVSKGRLERDEALRIAAQIVMGLEHCHHFKICHRDLKPENLLLDSNGNIKIGDFGMAQLMKKDGVLKTSCGSPHYASPEIIKGEDYDAKCTDVWSIGVILFALITGSLPFDHDNIPTLLTMVTKGHYTTPAHVPADIAHLISRMLTVDPRKRITIPEIKKHICFRGKNYFSTNDKDAALSVEAISRSLSTGEQTAAAPSPAAAHATKKAKGSANASLANFDMEDSHSWRKTSSGAKVDTQRHSDTIAAPAPAPATTLGSLAHHQQQHQQKTHHHHHHSHQASPATSNLLDDGEAIDEGVLNDLESLGLGSHGSREDLKRMIIHQTATKGPSLEAVFYKLLRQRKIDRLKQLAYLSPKIEPRPSRVPGSSSRRVSHHASHSVMAAPIDSAVAQPNSAFTTPRPSPTGTDDLGQMAEMTLPPPHPRSSPSSAKTPAFHDDMEDITPISNPSGVSMYSSTNSSPVIGVSSAPNTATVPLQSSIFAGANAFAATFFDRTAAAQPTGTKAEAAPSDASNATVALADKSMDTPASAVQSTITPGLPSAIETTTAAQPGASTVTPPGPPPYQRCYSDGTLPPTIMDNDYTMAMSKGALLPPLQTPTRANMGDVEELPSSPSSSVSSNTGSPVRRPVIHPFATVQNTSVSAYSSPHRAPASAFAFNRRMSTPLVTGAEDTVMSAQQAALDRFSAQMSDGAAPAVERMTDVDEAPDRYVAGAEKSTVHSTPLHALQNTTSPPLLSLPRIASAHPNTHTPHIHVSSESSSGSENDDSAHGSKERLQLRPRAFSQDETNLKVRPHHLTAPSDRVASNVRTPLLTSQDSPVREPTTLPAYSTSPRFHRVKWQDQPTNQPTTATTAMTATSSSRVPSVGATPTGKPTFQAPPSPAPKKSWFSSVFGSGK